MPMNVKPVPTLDDEVNEVRLATAEIVNNDILPHENKLWAHRTDGGRPSKDQVEEAHELRVGVQNKVKKANLWASRTCRPSSAAWACPSCSTHT